MLSLAQLDSLNHLEDWKLLETEEDALKRCENGIVEAAERMGVYELHRRIVEAFPQCFGFHHEGTTS